MENKRQLIYVDDAKRAIEHIDPAFASVIDNVPTVDTVEADKALAWIEGYAFTDTEQVYTNGAVLVPLFRVKQALEYKAYNGLMEG